MGLQITIKNDIDQIGKFLDAFQQQALVSATRKSMNRSIMSVRTQANRMAREQRKLKASEINNDFFDLQKASGSDLSRLQASLKISGKPMSIIRFIVGPKERFSQAGIAVKDRRKVRVEVKPGKKVDLSGAFIAEGKSGNLHVFRRRGVSRHPIVKQSAPSLATIFEKRLYREQLELFMREKFAAEFKSTMQWEVQRLIDKKANSLKAPGT